MDIGFGPDQHALAENVRDVLASACPLDLARRSADDADAWTDLWAVVGELGWAAVADHADPEAGYTPLDLVAVLEQCGAAVVGIPLLSGPGLAGGALRHGGPEAAPALARIVDGASATAAIQAPGARLPGAAFTISGAGKIRGTAVAVTDTARADFIVALASHRDARDPNIVTIAVLDTAACVVSAGDSVDPGRPLAEVCAHDVTPDLVATADLRWVLADQMLCAAAELVGVAGAALDMSVSYSTTRVQFDRPIGAFQSVKHALVDNYVALERARSLTYSAATILGSVDASPDDAWTAGALAKAAANEAALAATRTGVQVHGAIAQTWEHDMHLYLRRAWSGSTLVGETGALYGAVGAAYAAAGVAS